MKKTPKKKHTSSLPGRQVRIWIVASDADPRVYAQTFAPTAERTVTLSEAGYGVFEVDVRVPLAPNVTASLPRASSRRSRSRQ